MNIFAEQLVDVLTKHKHELSNLFTWKYDIPPSLVVRLKASLTMEKSATLNTEQIDFIAEKYDFDEDDHRRLRAALLAEAVRKMVADRLSTNMAYKLGMVTLELLLSDDPDEVMQACQVLVTEMRDLPDLVTGTETVRGLIPDGERDLEAHPLVVAAHTLADAPSFDAGMLLALDGAEEAYYQGLLWLELARDTDRRLRAGYAAQARVFFTRAQEQGRQCAAFAQGSPEQASLLANIQTANEDAEGLF